MHEKMPKDSQEVNAAQHEKITFLLQMLVFKYGRKYDATADDPLCTFSSDEYRELASVYGYDSMVIGTDEDDSVIVELAYDGEGDEQRIETYIYSPEDRSLLLHTIIEYDNEHIDHLNARLDHLADRANVYKNESQAALTTLIEGLRSTDRWAGVFANYDAIKEKIAAKRQAIDGLDNQDELRHQLDLCELENEAINLDLLDKLAGIDEGVADLLQRYRQPLALIKAIEGEMSNLIEQIDTESSKEEPMRDGDPDKFISLLGLAQKLKKDSPYDNL